jgi:hypothetical protein
MIKITRNISILTAILLILSACNLPTGTPPADEANAIFTQAAWTVEAQLTQSSQFNTPTLPPAPATNTPESLPATVTPTLASAASPTAVCDQAQFVRDVTIPDGTTFAPGTTFTKTWRLRNAGVCTWSGYSLVFDRGDAMNGTSPISIGTVGPGQEVDISVSLTAPSTVGSYRGYWRIRNSSGVLIPVLSGTEGRSFFVDIKVAVTSAGFDLHTRASASAWSSGAGNLTFGGPETDANGFAMYKDGAKLEDGTTPSKVVLTYPQWVDNGFITGRYAAYQVVTGERFKARIGFLALPNGNCGSGNVKFQLKYREGGVVKSLNEWTKSCNGTLTNVDVELNSLAGKMVEFILTVDANGSSTEDWAVWVAPRVEIP